MKIIRKKINREISNRLTLKRKIKDMVKIIKRKLKGFVNYYYLNQNDMQK